MPRAKPLVSFGLLLACLALLAFLGSKVGRQLARSGLVHSSAPAKKAEEREASPRKAVGTQAVRGDLVAASIRKLNALVAGSPDLRTDWETQAEMDSIIAKLSAAELAEVFAGVGSGFQDGLQILDIKIGAAWMTMDPDSVLKAALAKRPNDRGSLASSIFGAWTDEDPKGALAWLNSAEMPEKPPTLREDLRVAGLYQLVERDFELATSEYLKITGPASNFSSSSSLIGLWGHQYADDPAMRDRLVEFAKSTGRPQDYADLNRELLRAWPQEDAMGTMNYLQELRSYLESDAVPADARPEVDAKAVGAAIFREYDRPALEWWMDRYGQSAETPGPLKEAMAAWAQKYPDAMLNWFQEQPPSPQRDALAASVVPSLIRQQKFTEAAKSIGNMQDLSQRQASAERLNLLWSEQDAAAAAAWRATLPEGILGSPE